MGRMTRAEAYRIRGIVETAAQHGLTDQEASVAPTLFPGMPLDGKEIKPGFRICWKGNVMKAAVTCWAREDNNPDNAPTLWEDLPYRKGYRIIPEIISAPAAFAKGERGWWKDQLYESLRNGNVHNPEQYAKGWKLVTA